MKEQLGSAPSNDSSAETRQQDGGTVHTPFRWRDEQNSPPRLTVEVARQLVRAALPSGEDEVARALIQLLAGIAYEPDALQRDALTVCAAEEAYTLTEAFSCALDAFAMGGEAEQKE
jgi:hypothetical protein